MTAAHAGIDDTDIFRIQLRIFRANLSQFLLYFRLLLRLLQIVFPPDFQVVIRMSLHPKTAKAVLHHVADDPVRRKELRDRRHFFLRNLALLRKGVVLRLCIVILIQPADDLHLPAALYIEILFRDIMDKMPDHAVLINDGQIQQKLCIITGLLKKSRQNLIQCVALLDKEQPERFIQLVLLFQPVDFLLLCSGKDKLRVKGIRHEIRLHLAGIGREHTDMGRQVIVDLHKTHGNQAVEPGIGNLLQYVLICSLIIRLFLFFANQFHQTAALFHFSTADGIRLCRADIVKLRHPGRLRQRFLNTVHRNPHQTSTVADIRKQFISCPDGKVLYGSLIHTCAPFFRTPHLQCRFLSTLPAETF